MSQQNDGAKTTTVTSQHEGQQDQSSATDASIAKQTQRLTITVPHGLNDSAEAASATAVGISITEDISDPFFTQANGQDNQSTRDPAPATTTQDAPQKGFFKLPAEMRNSVYRFVLINHIPHRGVSPNIIAVSKQLHQEARDILYAENVIHIDLSIDENDPSSQPEVEFRAHIHTDEPILSTWSSPLEEPDVRSPHTELLHGQFHWPLYLASISQLRISIQLDAQWAVAEHRLVGLETPLWQISHALWSLGSFFENQGHRLQNLSIDIKVKPSTLQETMSGRKAVATYGNYTAFDDEHGLTLIQNVLWQLGRIGKLKSSEDLKITGLEPVNEALLRARIMSMPSNWRKDDPQLSLEITTSSFASKRQALVAHDYSLNLLGIAREPPTLDGNAEPPHDDPETSTDNPHWWGQSEQIKREESSPEARQERLISQASKLPAYFDLLDKFWVLFDEAARRFEMLRALPLAPAVGDAWPRGQLRVDDEEEKDDPVHYAIRKIEHLFEQRAIGPGEEMWINFWCTGLEERLDDFFNSMRDGRLSRPTEQQIDHPPFRRYLEARDTRLREMLRIGQRMQLRDGGKAEDGLSAGLFGDQRMWDVIARQKEEAEQEVEGEEGL